MGNENSSTAYYGKTASLSSKLEYLISLSKGYDIMTNKIMAWEKFHKVVEDLRACSQNLGVFENKVSETATSIRDSLDDRDNAIQSVTEWCQLTLQKFSPYLTALATNVSGSLTATKRGLIMILDEGIKMFEDAQDKLQKASKSLNEAASNMVNLIQRLDKMKGESADKRDQSITQRRVTAYASAGGATVGAGAIGTVAPLFLLPPPIGLILGAIAVPIAGIVSFSVAAGTVEGSQVPTLRATHETNVTTLEQLKDALKNQEIEIEEMKRKHKEDVNKFGTLKVQGKCTKDALEDDDSVFGREEAVRNVKKLVSLCEKYV